MNDKKAIPVGTEFYKEIIDNDLYYVDKTLFIRDLLKQKNKVSLFTRPRRFGKTLMQSMIQTFFEQQTDKNGNIADNSKYFTGKKLQSFSQVRFRIKFPNTK